MPTDPPRWLTDLVRATGALPADPPPPPVPGRAAAVLVLFGEGAHGPDLLFIERSEELRAHAGQPAFPGGMVDPQDGGPVQAALREAAEETGLDPAGVTPLGVLDALEVTVSAVAVTPVLAWWHDPAEVGPVDPGEVAAVARIAVAELADPANRLRVRGPSGYAGPGFHAGGLLIWGFTAFLVDGLLAAGGWEQPWDTSRVEPLPPDALRLALRHRRLPAGS